MVVQYMIPSNPDVRLTLRWVCSDIFFFWNLSSFSHFFPGFRGRSSLCFITRLPISYKLCIHKGRDACLSLDMSQFCSLLSSSIAKCCFKKDISFKYIHKNLRLTTVIEKFFDRNGEPSFDELAKRGMSLFYLKPWPKVYLIHIQVRSCVTCAVPAHTHFRSGMQWQSWGLVINVCLHVGRWMTAVRRSTFFWYLMYIHEKTEWTIARRGYCIDDFHYCVLMQAEKWNCPRA